MNWKTESRLSDLDPATQIEVTCRRCGLTRYMTPREIMTRPRLRQATLDMAEAALSCADRYCKGRVRVAFVHDDLNEPFVGGLA
ncbi:hypothetical protein CCC_00309 [Paramagnetospirillum magnetotacticum MS-1]|uniref:Uncharacterized protein n=1 Tax=Paramagnetospirillum magnetotacticum MS-1 TaxID=272627 RepID=A0A0C2YQ51_PARME|nr:hypothetical protein [Paramagnetospirillum magnetotacticum]KIL97248.1 hypothetical protein CCC_00309 [Paramagnetospirillum magnetotacticum MS-1]